ncbi:MAG TPA: histidine phosphatase family protein [Gemmatimonadaceae bacterium]|nr:histidine phosphatase family protein [Gemmatimonadaceae bacterium]
MRYLSSLLLVLAAALAIPVTARAQQPSSTVVVLVRHAEKAATPADDPPLTREGEARALALWTTLRYSGVDAAITTNFARTRMTAAPTIAERGITPEVLQARNPNHVQEVVAAIKRYSGHTVLVVGHSNTVPAIIAALGAEQPSNICDETYDDLFIVTLRDGRKPELVHGRYGAPSPVATCASMK